MSILRRALLSGAAAATCLAWFAVGGTAAAQAYPSKPVTLIVPAAAGGPTDTVARLIAESMTKTFGQTVVVENVGGAGGTIGMAKVARAAPDGYTIAVWHIAQSTAPALYDGLKYDVVGDFDHLGRITDVPMTLVSKAGLPPKDIAEIIAWMKANQGKATYGHAGIGSASHLCMLILMKELGIKMEGVGYRGTGPAMNDLISGTFDVMCDQTTNTTGHIKDGRIKGYAVTTKAKVASVPGLPTLDSGALPGFEVSAWHALWAPKGLPKDVTDKLVAALKIALKDPKVLERFAGLGTEPVAEAQVSPGALKTYLESEVKRWDAVIKAAGVKASN
ncbi:tripartite tricarboxylate transporter substrate-binding protein [uncultured Reyranella sp.]|uniref:tripartite tricarboxylate transporter substrate-binding protein n=1 Tax=uncultured Reyranella sp. TaxID=735512 RepID=UPI0025DA436C|nr:tripartite tricarboxylate transporter substrate-binding protein [uncultured Reyranella sp.]